MSVKAPQFSRSVGAISSPAIKRKNEFELQSNNNKVAPKKQFIKFKCDLEDSYTLNSNVTINTAAPVPASTIHTANTSTTISTRSKDVEKTKTVVKTRGRKLKVVTMTHVPHYLIPGLNAHPTIEPQEIELHTEINKTNELSTSFPWPLYISEEEPNEIDLCHKRVKSHDEYIFNLRRSYSCYNACKNKKEYKKARKKNIYPYIAIQFAELLEQNPDPYFNSKYDWYYTGGNLCSIKNDNFYSSNESYIFHVIGSNLNKLVLSKITNSNYNKIQLNSLVSSEESSEIFEVQPTTVDSNSNLACITRQKYLISYYDYSVNNEENNLSCSYKIHSENVPFISFTTDNETNSHLITTDFHKTIKLWDINKSTTEPLQILQNKLFNYDNEEYNIKKDSNWNCIRYFKPYIFTYTDLYNFGIIDTRINNQTLKLSSFLQSSCDACEKISILQSSKLNENHLYFGTSHKLLSTDLRYFGNNHNNNKKFIITEWKHQMLIPPIMLDTFLMNNDELNETILTASPYYEDIRLCNHISSMTKSLNFYSTLPLMPKNSQDVLNDIRCEGYHLNALQNIQSRVKCCNTGIIILNLNQQNFILQSNSIGDIFIQKLQMPNELLLEHSIEENNFIKEQWKIYNNKLILRNEQKSLNATCVENFLSFEKVFRCKRLDHQQQQEENIELNDLNEPKRSKRLRKWQKPIEELQKYKDALAKDLLSIWDCDFNDEDKNTTFDVTAVNTTSATFTINEDERKGISGANLNLKELSKIVENKTDPKEKISDWLDCTLEKINLDNSINEVDPMTTLNKMTEFPSIELNTSLNISKLNDISLELGDIDEVLDTSGIIPSTSRSIVKKQVKKKKYTIGF